MVEVNSKHGCCCILWLSASGLDLLPAAAGALGTKCSNICTHFINSQEEIRVISCIRYYLELNKSHKESTAISCNVVALT